ncbi:MAG: GTP-binding protein [Thermoplasmata archaeon]|nr:GTP-binding protein [Thermoplasmata archaeon]
MATIEEQIREIEEEIRKTPYNKKSQHHIGKLKAKVAHLKEETEKRRSRKGIAAGYAVRKSGNATVSLAGFPSVGKSTLLNRITNARSEVGAYNFTTLDVVPGLLEYRGAKIQILDLPGLIKDASKGRGRGREVISVVRASDLIVLMIDVFETNLHILVDELALAGIRLNQRPPDVQISKRLRGGISVNTTVPLTKIDEEMVREMMREFGIANADVVIREDLNEDRLIDAISKNRHYAKAIVVLNKIDLVNETYIKEIERRFKNWHIVPISAEKNHNIELVKDEIFEALSLVRVYMKPQGREADLVEPLVIRKGTDVGGVCDALHRDFRRKFRYALVWGKSAKFPGQIVGLEHGLLDGDILTIIVKRQ